MDTYAIIQTGGKQYRVSAGDVITVEKLPVQPGERLEFDQVYLLSREGQILAGTPALQNARVVAEVLDQDRSKKIIVFKHRRRKGYRKTMGHRQYVTRLRIVEIVHEGARYGVPPEKQAPVQKQPVVSKKHQKKDQAGKIKKKDKEAVKPVTAEANDSIAAPEPLQPKSAEQPEVPAAAAVVEPPAREEPAAEPVGTPAPASSPAVEPPTQVAVPLVSEVKRVAAEANDTIDMAEPQQPKSTEQPEAPAASPAAAEPAGTPAPASSPAVEPPTQVARPAVSEAPAPAVPVEQEAAPDSRPEHAAPAPEPVLPVAPAASAAEERTRREEPAGPSPAGSNRRKVIAAALAVLALLALLLLLGRDRSPTAPGTPREISAPTVPVKAVKKRPQVSDVKTKETAPVAKPDAPVQPPD